MSKKKRWVNDRLRDLRKRMQASIGDVLFAKSFMDESKLAFSALENDILHLADSYTLIGNGTDLIMFEVRGMIRENFISHTKQVLRPFHRKVDTLIRIRLEIFIEKYARTLFPDPTISRVGSAGGRHDQQR